MQTIEIELSQTQYEPGEIMTGRVVWNFSKAPKQISLQIAWHTEGRGSEDSHIEYEQHWDTDMHSGSQNFRFKLPPSPYSFSGTLIELIWSVSAFSKCGKEYTHTDIVVAPQKKVVKL